MFWLRALGLPRSMRRFVRLAAVPRVPDAWVLGMGWRLGREAEAEMICRPWDFSDTLVLMDFDLR